MEPNAGINLKSMWEEDQMGNRMDVFSAGPCISFRTRFVGRQLRPPVPHDSSRVLPGAGRWEKNAHVPRSEGWAPSQS